MLTIEFYHASFFFLIIDLHYFNCAAIEQIFNPNAELVNPIGISNKEAKVEIEIHSEIDIHPVTAEAKIK